MGKGELRRRLLRQRDALPQDVRQAADEALCRHVLALPAFRDAPVVLSYLSMGSEVETRRIIDAAWQAGKVVALPRVVGPRVLRWYRVGGPSGLASLERSAFGVLEPADDPACEVVPDMPALALVPGLAFDRRGFRLGYGGGFYDVFLSGFAGASLGLARSVSLLDELAVREAHDLPVRQVVTERGVVVT